MKDDDLKEDASYLKAATVHWLHHTGISEDVKFKPREHVIDDADHASMQTTDRFIVSDLRERHELGKQKRVREGNRGPMQEGELVAERVPVLIC